MRRGKVQEGEEEGEEEEEEETTRRSVSLQTHIKSASFVVAHICNPNSPIAGRDTEIRESPRSHLLPASLGLQHSRNETLAQEQDGRED